MSADNQLLIEATPENCKLDFTKLNYNEDVDPFMTRASITKIKATDSDLVKSIKLNHNKVVSRGFSLHDLDIPVLDKDVREVLGIDLIRGI